MGIETALIGGAVLGSGLNAYGANKAGKTAAKGFQIGGQQAEEAINAGYNDAMKYLSPYTQFGEQTLPYLQQYMEQKPFSYGDFFNSQQYKDLSAQQEEQSARNSLAMGQGLRSGNAAVAMSAIAPQLAMHERAYQDQARQQQFGNLFNLAQFGAGFGQNAAQLGTNRGNALADYRYNAATGGAGARAQGQQAMFGGLGQIGSDIGSIYAGSKMGYFG